MSMKSYGNELDQWLGEEFSKLETEVDDPCTDNFRVCDLDVPSEVDAYDEQARGGCCGSVDVEIVHPGTGRRFCIGFNYGH